MANISDLSGDEREQRIAELKQKMQDAARQRQEEQAAAAAEPEADAGSDAGPEAAADTAADSPAQPVAAASDTEADTVNIEASTDETSDDAESQDDLGEAAPAESASVADEAVAVATASDASVETTPAPSAEDAAAVAAKKAKTEMNRREFLTYSWGAAVGALLLGTGVVSFQFMYPRFKAGEFGGAFLMGPEGSVPPTDAAPEAVADGKFWWVNVEGEGPKAIYMVCTHLGCLYKWVDERDRFECPCHGSKFTREGLYIEGPAPRSLDLFVTTLEEDIWVVDTGAKILGAPASESSAAGTG